MSRSVLRILLALPLLLCLNLAQAAIEELDFASAQDRARYEKLVEELRCPKCTSGNLAGSDAPIAADLRAEIYKQIEAGRTDEEIQSFMTARYGDFILYRPPLKPGTVLLWFGPLLFLLVGLFIVRRMVRANNSELAGEGGSDAALSSEEQRKLDALLRDSGKSS